jgi:predicted nuclease with TOPRIM domain
LQDSECRELVIAYKQKRLDLKRLRSQHEDLEHRSKLLSDKAETLKTSLAEYVKGTEQLAEKLAGKPVKVELGQDAL